MENNKTKYTKKQLERLTTLQLRDICFKEKIVKGIANMLDREAFINAILTFRGLNEDYLIKNYDQAGHDRLRTLIKTQLGEALIPKKPLHSPAKLTVYQTLAIKPRDAYQVITEDQTLAETNVLLVDENYSLCGIFYLLQQTGSPKTLYLCKSASMAVTVTNNKKYRLLYFPPDSSTALFEVYYNKNVNHRQLNYYQVALPNLEVKELAISRETLAIDFGTSNTTAGIYLSEEGSAHFSQHDLFNKRLKINDINYVLFENVASQQQEWLPVLPTIVGVAACGVGDEIKFQYGYEVILHNNLANANDLSSIFYEIKRWVNNFHAEEELSDPQGNIAQVKRGEIIAGYLKYVIKTAEQQFKCHFQHLHISSPVKLKHQFIEMFEAILPDYEFEKANALDEGVAVLYNTIDHQLAKRNFEAGIPYKALIIDCGGGTTDLSSCVFTITENRLNYFVDVKTTYENGDTNFGGNNLTYRLMQYLKILLTNYYTRENEAITYNEIMEILIGDVYRYLDANGKAALYQQLETKYQASEAFLPTKYQQYLSKSNAEYQRVKANYQTIWRLADELKQRFFADASLMQLDLLHAKLDALAGFKLSVLINHKLEYLYQIPDVRLTLPEVCGLLKGDIYQIIKKFLEALYNQDALSEYSIIKMTGQSCRIDLFRDSIKEFIPGRQIEFRQKENHHLDLKLACVNGVLKYLHAKKIGQVRAQIENATPVTPYAIFAYTHKNEKQNLLMSSKSVVQENSFIAKPRHIKELTFYLADVDGIVQTTYLYLNDNRDYRPITYQELRDEYGDYVKQAELDKIENEEVKFFIYTIASRWGFNVLPIARIAGELAIGRDQYFPFENEQWELNFFDGAK